VLWHCWLGHLTRKNPSPIWLIMCFVHGTLNLALSIYQRNVQEALQAAQNRRQYRKQKSLVLTFDPQQRGRPSPVQSSSDFTHGWWWRWCCNWVSNETNEWKYSDLKCVWSPTKSRLSLTHHANKSSRWAE